MMKNCILFLVFISAVLVTGCTSGEDTITPEITQEWTTPIPTPVPVVQTELTPEETQFQPDKPPGWKADGTIGEEEYENHITVSRDLFDIYWTSDDENLYMGMKGKTAGWISVGFNPTVGMLDSDIVIGGNDGTNGETYIYDMYSIGTYGPHPSDTEIGGTFDITEYAADEGSAYTTVEFSRKLDTGDEYDSVLKRGETAKVLWSLSYTDAIQIKHNAGKGIVEITI